MVLLLLSFTAVNSASAFSGTPPQNRTGAPGHSTCAACHLSTGAGSATLDFSGLGSYQPGQSYSLEVTVSDAAKLRFGFSMVARDSDNNTVDVGTWSAGSADTQTYAAMNTHVGHSNAPFDVGTHTFIVNWEAPSPGVGDVTFYLAAVAANGNGSNGSGDNVYVETLTISEPSPNQAPSISGPGGTVQVTSEAEFPITGLSISDPDAGAGSLTVSLTVQNGTITVDDAVPGGVLAAGITNNGSAVVTVEGSLAALNATLGDAEGILYRSDQLILGNDSLLVLVNDNGHTGTGGAQTDNLSVALFVNPPPSYSEMQRSGDGSLEFTLTGIPGLSYAIEHTQDLETWIPKEQVTLVGATAVITDNTAGLEQRFYRARQVP